MLSFSKYQVCVVGDLLKRGTLVSRVFFPKRSCLLLKSPVISVISPEGSFLQRSCCDLFCYSYLFD